MGEKPKTDKEPEIPDDADVFSCGCAIWNKDGVFYLHACDERCRIVQIAVEQSNEKGSKVTFRHKGRAAG